MTNEPKETAFQKRMRKFHEAQALIAAARQRAKGGDAWQEQTDSSDSQTGF